MAWQEFWENPKLWLIDETIFIAEVVLRSQNCAHVYKWGPGRYVVIT